MGYLPAVTGGLVILGVILFLAFCSKEFDAENERVQGWKP